MEEELLEEISAKLDVLHTDLVGIHNDLVEISEDTTAIYDATSANGVVLQQIQADTALLALASPQVYTDSVSLDDVNYFTISHFRQTTLGDWVLAVLLLYLAALQSFRVFFNATRGGSL